MGAVSTIFLHCGELVLGFLAILSSSLLISMTCVMCYLALSWLHRCFKLKKVLTRIPDKKDIYRTDAVADRNVHSNVRINIWNLLRFESREHVCGFMIVSAFLILS